MLDAAFEPERSSLGVLFQVGTHLNPLCKGIEEIQGLVELMKNMT